MQCSVARRSETLTTERQRKDAMTNTPPSADASRYLESLMRAGQDAMKQFDDALAAAAGMRGKEANPPGQFFSLFGLIADLQREYFRQLWRFWNTIFLQAIPGGTVLTATLAKSDRRFKDEAWNEQPYFELPKQSYLLGSRQLHEFVCQSALEWDPSILDADPPAQGVKIARRMTGLAASAVTGRLTSGNIRHQEESDREVVFVETGRSLTYSNGRTMSRERNSTRLSR